MSRKRTTQVVAQEYATVSVDELKPHPDNPRQGDLGAICESIDANGFYGAVVAQQSTGHILAGNHRWKAAITRGLKYLPVLWLNVDDATALRILLADNRTADLASWDNAALAELLQSVISGAGSLDGTGFDGDALDELIQDLGNQQIEAEEQTAVDSKPRKHVCPNCQFEFSD